MAQGWTWRARSASPWFPCFSADSTAANGFIGKQRRGGSVELFCSQAGGLIRFGFFEFTCSGSMHYPSMKTQDSESLHVPRLSSNTSVSSPSWRLDEENYMRIMTPHELKLHDDVGHTIPTSLSFNPVMLQFPQHGSVSIIAGGLKCKTTLTATLFHCLCCS